MLAWMSWMWALLFTARSPISSVSPTTCPPLIPAPAMNIENPHGLWSRPEPFSLKGVRPNSPPHTTSVVSSSPCALRSVSSPAMGLSTLAHIFPWLPSMSVWASHPLPLPE